MQNVSPGDKEALTGDLIEKFREGHTPGWFWRQVLIAFGFGVLTEMRRHWPYFCYAIVGTAIPALGWKALGKVPRLLHWWALPWPWSRLIFEMNETALLALAALPVLAVGLAVKGTFRWISLLRTAAINLALITLGKYLLDALGPWLSRPVPGDPYSRYLAIPGILQVALFFSTFLVAAWVGCISPRMVNGFRRQAG